MSGKPRIYWPCEPFEVVQSFGNDPVYYARFHDSFGNPLKGHMGIDVRAPHGRPVRSSHDGNAFFHKDSHGGEGIIVISPEGFETIYWHLVGDTDANFPSPIPMDGKLYPVKAGDLIGYADNTGAPFESSGDHLHFGMKFLDPDGSPINPDNGFGACVDPTPFFTGIYAKDVPKTIGYYQAIIGLLTRVVAALKSKQ